MADTIAITDVGAGAKAAPAPLCGRAPVRLPYEELDETNVVEALNLAIPTFAANSGQTDYLWRYYRGIQPVLDREKDVRPEINNTIVVNFAQEIVSFKIGYQLNNPLVYACRMTEDEGLEGYDEALAQVNELNTMMFAEDKASADRDLFEWMCICGHGFRFAVADSERDVEDGGAPFELHTLDPRATFVAESSSYDRHPLMGVWVGRERTETGTRSVYNVYTDTHFYRIAAGELLSAAPHTYGRCPIVEYKLNNARMGVFEPVLPLLDAINALESNRLDDVEQTVQALMVFKDCLIDSEEFDEMREKGAVLIRSMEGAADAAITMLLNPLDQSGTQQLKDDLYQAVVNICGMPNRNGQGGSTSDTGAAVLLRDGWTLAESHAKSYELQFKRAERDFLRVVLSICRDTAGCPVALRIRDIELVFNRRNYENVLTKSQVLTTMLATNKIHPKLAFQACGLFTDPDAAYRESQEWADEQAEKAPQIAVPAPDGEDGGDGGEPGAQAGEPGRQDGDGAA